MTVVSFRRALGLGASTAFHRPTPVLLLGLAGVAASCCTALLWLSGLRSLEDEGLPMGVLGLLLAAVAAWTLQAALLGGAVRQGGAALRGQEVPSLLEAIRTSVPRALGWAVLAGAALLAWHGWVLLLGASGMLLYLRGLVHAGGGLLGALGLALAATVGPLGALLLQLTAEMALVRSVLRDEPAALAGWEAARALLGRPWTPAGLWALTALLAIAVAGTAAVLSGLGTPTSGGLAEVPALLQLAIAALASAVAQLVRLDAFAALELGRTGELPAPPPLAAKGILRAELVPEEGGVLEARAVGPSSGADG